MKVLKIKIILPIFILLISFEGCVSTKEKDDKQIKETVQKFWKIVKDNNFEGYKNMVEDNQNFLGGMQAEFSFLHKNYEKINPNDILQKNIIIKDTSIAGPYTQQKYVQYTIKNKQDMAKIGFEKPHLKTR